MVLIALVLTLAAGVKFGVSDDINNIAHEISASKFWDTE